MGWVRTNELKPRQRFFGLDQIRFGEVVLMLDGITLTPRLRFVAWEFTWIQGCFLMPGPGVLITSLGS